MKNKLQEVYSSLVMEIHAAALKQRKQTKDQKLIDYISDFTDLCYKSEGKDPTNYVVIAVFSSNLYNKEIRRRVIGAKNLNTLADALKSATYNQLKLLWYKGLQFVRKGEIDDQDQNEEMTIN